MDDLVIEQVIRKGTADIGGKYLDVMKAAARDYTAEIFRKLREHEYNPELMRLYDRKLWRLCQEPGNHYS